MFRTIRHCCIFGVLALSNICLANWSGTHNYFFDQAETILRNDRYWTAADWTRTYLDDLQDGSHWADWGGGNAFGIPWSAYNHYCNPWGWGMPGALSAAQLADIAFDAAIYQWSRGRYSDAAFALGVACHMVQDATVPHHSNVTCLDGHSWYERRCDNYADPWHRRYNAVTVISGGRYDWRWNKLPSQWVLECAAQSQPLLPRCNQRNPTWWWPWETRDDTVYVASRMMPLAQRETAGLIAWFLWRVRYH